MQASTAPPALYRIDTLNPEGTCVAVTLTPATPRGQEPFAGSICAQGSVTILRTAQARSNLVAVTRRAGDGEPVILPVTVALSVEPSGEEGEDTLYFAPPRPAMLRVRRSGDALEREIAALAGEGKGAVFALENGIYVTDAIAISGDMAERWLGFAP